jgi:hypothetical protein
MAKKIKKKQIVRRAAVLTQVIESKILFLRGEKVMLDTSLAELYQVDTSSLNRAVKRNLDRFPKDFMFQLTAKEVDCLRCQIGISNDVDGRGGRRYLPYAFTEQGVAMLSSVLNGTRAVQVNIAIMRAFVKLREVMATHKDLAHKIEILERNYAEHGEQLEAVFKAIRQMLEPEQIPVQRRIGFRDE